tara:strand:- start:129 stop:1556 length:1428 start_codon:yes stop_codon:yes gene_type:complete
MTALTGSTPAASYKDLLQISNSNAGIDGTLRAIEDGEGSASILSLSTTAISAAADMNVTTGNSYNINDVDTLNATTLGTAVVTSSLTTVGALDAGSITSNFGAIDNGASAITTTGTITAGAVTSSGVVSVDDNTQSTTTTGGSIHTDGGVGIVKDVVIGGVIKMADGSNTSPAYTFSGDTDTGIYRNAGNGIGITTGGVLRLSVDQNGLITSVGVISVDDTTQSTSTITGSIHTDGGLGVVKDTFLGGAVDVTGTLSMGTINLEGAILGSLTSKSAAIPSDSFILKDSEDSSILKEFLFSDVMTAFNTMYEQLANKDAAGGYVGMTSLKINLRNSSGTVTNFFTTASTAARTWTMQDRNGIIADDTDLALKQDIQTITGDATTARTLALTDANDYIRFTSATDVIVTVPLNSAVAFPIGTRVDLFRAGAGNVSVAATGGVTINKAEGLKIAAQYKGATLIKVATDEWDLVGALAA